MNKETLQKWIQKEGYNLLSNDSITTYYRIAGAKLSTDIIDIVNTLYTNNQIYFGSEIEVEEIKTVPKYTISFRLLMYYYSLDINNNILISRVFFNLINYSFPYMFYVNSITPINLSNLTIDNIIPDGNFIIQGYNNGLIYSSIGTILSDIIESRTYTYGTKTHKLFASQISPTGTITILNSPVSSYNNYYITPSICEFSKQALLIPKAN